MLLLKQEHGRNNTAVDGNHAGENGRKFLLWMGEACQAFLCSSEIDQDLLINRREGIAGQLAKEAMPDMVLILLNLADYILHLPEHWWVIIIIHVSLK